MLMPSLPGDLSSRISWVGLVFLVCVTHSVLSNVSNVAGVSRAGVRTVQNIQVAFSCFM